MSNENKNLDIIAADIRKKIFKTAVNAKAGHIASSFSMVEIITVLYFGGVLRYDPKQPDLADRDRFVLSKGHGALALYTVLAKTGYISENELYDFCKLNSNLGGLPRADHVPGVEATTGSLGHGFPYGVGIALAGKNDRTNFNVYVLIGDGECQEGSVWEAAMTASHFNLKNLTVVIDHNKVQATDKLNNISNLEPLYKKWDAFGFNAIEVDGHNVCEIKKAFNSKSKIPKVIICHTTKGKGISFMENQAIWHAKQPNDDEINIGLVELKMTKEEL